MTDRMQGLLDILKQKGITISMYGKSNSILYVCSNCQISTIITSEMLTEMNKPFASYCRCVAKILVKEFLKERLV